MGVREKEIKGKDTWNTLKEERGMERKKQKTDVRRQEAEKERGREGGSLW